MSLDELTNAIKALLQKPSGKITSIVLVIILSCLFICLCLFALIIRGDNSSAAEVAPTADYNLMPTQAYETALASIPTNTPVPAAKQPQATPTAQPTSTSLPLLLPTPTASFTSSIPACIRPQTPQTGTVVQVVDGDTIRVIIDGAEYPIRYIGIDTPESTTQIEPFGKEAAAKNAELVAGQQVTLYRDVSETDKFDRILRFVFVGDVFVNYELVRRGYANAFRYPPDVSCADYFAEAERDARSNGVGFWAAQATYESSSPQATLVIVAVNKVAEFVDVKNETSSPIDLAGWRLVSEKGSQTCNLGGIIQPRETLRIYAQTGENGYNCNFAKTIWNNSEPDPAVLYNPDGVEVSRK